jgi:very-short-patch-repair endonuclease
MTPTTKLNRALLAELLRKQHQVIARRQIITCGMTEGALRARIRPGGPWQRLLPGVYLGVTGTPTTDQRDMAGLLYAGPGSILTAAAALRRLGLRAPRVDVVDILVPAARRRQNAGFVRVLRTTRMPEQACISGQIRFAMAARAVADAARTLKDLGEVRAVVAGSVQRRWCRVTELAEELRRGPATGSAHFRRVLAEVADGIRSAAEADLRDLVKRAGLPMPMFNARLYAGQVLIGVADAWWPEAAVAAEVDSREWHLSPGDWERTLRRHARLTSHGILVLHFTPKQIRTEPAAVVAAIRAALDAARADGQPRVRALPASA